MSVHDRWNGARSGQGRRYEVRWRDGGEQHKRRFDSKAAADRFDAERKLAPEVRNAREGRTLTVGRMMDTWLATKLRHRPKTVEAATLDAGEVKAEFDKRLAKELRPSEVRLWVARDRGASVRRRSLAALRQAYRLAVQDGLVGVDPTEGIPLPKPGPSDRSGLTWEQLERLADSAESDPELIWLLGTCGLRLGEAVALDTADVMPARLRVRYAKGGKTREVPIPAFVREMLDLSEPGPLFRSPSGKRLSAHNWRARVFEPAADKAGLGVLTVTKDDAGKWHRTYVGLVPHSLRHTAASLAVQEGADVMAVQRMLGHASPSITLNVYSHLFDGSLDSVAAGMDSARGRMVTSEGAIRAHHAPSSVLKSPDAEGSSEDEAPSWEAEVASH